MTLRNCRVKQIQQPWAKFRILPVAVLCGDGFDLAGGCSKIYEPQSSQRIPRRTQRNPIRSPSFVFVPEYTAVFHHKGHGSQRIDVVQRIAVDGDDVGVGPGRYYADLACHIEHVSGA